MGEFASALTVSALRDAIAARLADAVPSPLADARELLSALHDGPRSWSTVHADDAVHDLLRELASAAAERRRAGAPIAYAAGRAAFRHFFLHVDERVLIPRPETEELVTLALPYIGPGSLVVDVGTGSGAIALALARESRAARVIGIDVSPGAIAVAEMNARAVLLPTDARTEFRLGNLLDAVGAEQVDVIVSNPPYIAESEAGELPASVREWEPGLALFGGHDGMAVISALVRQAVSRLSAGGMVLLEIDARRGAETVALLGEPLWGDVRLIPDAFGRDRFVVARRTKATPRAGAGSDMAAGPVRPD